MAPEARTQQRRPPQLPHRGITRRDVVVLGIPTLGLALAITIISTYGPVVASRYTDNTTVIGVIIGGEGIMALWVPLIAGTWSDRLDTRFGGRLPFMIAATPLIIGALLVVATVHSLIALAILVGLFFFGYFVAYEPYRALFPDVVPDEYAGRGQSIQALWRGAGTGAALVAGGVMLGAAQFVPFVVAAVIVAVTLGGFVWFAVRSGRITRRPELEQEQEEVHGGRTVARQLARIIGEHPSLRAFLVANALWELSLGALKTFVVLYITVGLGQSLGRSSEVIGYAAIFIIAAAAISGRLADKLGTTRVLRVALLFYGLTLIIPLVTTNELILIVAVPFIAFAGGVIMTLPYALLIPMMPDHEHGALTGFYSLSRGIGTMLGPLLCGVTINRLAGSFDGTQGYQAMWLVCSAAILLSLPFLRWMRAQRRHELAGA